MNIKKTLINFNELVMFKHSIFSMPFIFVAIIVENQSVFIEFKLLFLAIIATITARNFAMGFNRYVDQKIDILNPRTKNRPSVDGRVTKNQMILFISINAFAFILTSYFVNSLAFYLSTPILFVLALYSYFKRFSYTAHLFLGFTLGLSPIAGVILVSSSIPLWSILLATGVMFWVAGFDLIYSIQDKEFDQKHNLHSIPAKLGIKKTLIISKIFHTLTVIFWSLFVYQSSLGVFAIIAIIVSAVILLLEHIIVIKSLNNITKAFFTMNGYLGIIFLILIGIDIL